MKKGERRIGIGKENSLRSIVSTAVNKYVNVGI
jgi:hypothetical protein